MGGVAERLRDSIGNIAVPETCLEYLLRQHRGALLFFLCEQAVRRRSHPRHVWVDGRRVLDRARIGFIASKFPIR